jgi:hypothetical protein
MPPVLKHEPKQKTKSFQIRWNEPLGDETHPYAHRYVLIFFGYSIRIHVWKCSDAVPNQEGESFMHNHPWWFITFVLKGSYTDVSETGKDFLQRFSIRYRPSSFTHYVEPSKGGCTTLLFTGTYKQKWGFKINGKVVRPLKFFYKHKQPICK